MLEYAVALGIIVAAVVGMSTYARRGIQSGIKAAADEMSPYLARGEADPGGELTQLDGMRYESGDRGLKTVAPGWTVVRESAAGTTTAQTQTRCERDCGAFEQRTMARSTETTGALTSRGTEVSSYSEVVVSTR